MTKQTIIKKATSTQEYVSVLAHLKKQIQESQIKAAIAANTELILLYWSIGKTIVKQQEKHGWGASIIDQLAKDLQNAFPGLSGFSRRNIFRMRAFFISYRKVPQPVAHIENLPFFKIPWGHNAVLLEKIKNTQERLWYAQQSIDNGWSRNTLESSIKSDFYHRKGKAVTNFQKTLPASRSDMANQALKDPYIFDFLTLDKNHIEKDIERGLIENVQKLLLELGKGFAFVGRQFQIEVGNTDFYIDLLFYHLKLRCYVVVELKARSFDPKDAGQLNFYLSAIDNQLRHKDDKPTIGLLLCRSKNRLIAEYALQGINKPIGVADYELQLVEQLPKDLKSSLPTIEELEAELTKQELLQKIESGNT